MENILDPTNSSISHFMRFQTVMPDSQASVPFINVTLYTRTGGVNEWEVFSDIDIELPNGNALPVPLPEFGDNGGDKDKNIRMTLDVKWRVFKDMLSVAGRTNGDNFMYFDAVGLLRFDTGAASGDAIQLIRNPDFYDTRFGVQANVDLSQTSDLLFKGLPLGPVKPNDEFDASVPLLRYNQRFSVVAIDSVVDDFNQLQIETITNADPTSPLKINQNLSYWCFGEYIPTFKDDPSLYAGFNTPQIVTAGTINITSSVGFYAGDNTENYPLGTLYATPPTIYPQMLLRWIAGNQYNEFGLVENSQFTSKVFGELIPYNNVQFNRTAAPMAVTSNFTSLSQVNASTGTDDPIVVTIDLPIIGSSGNRIRTISMPVVGVINLTDAKKYGQLPISSTQSAFLSAQVPTENWIKINNKSELSINTVNINLKHFDGRAYGPDAIQSVKFVFLIRGPSSVNKVTPTY